MTEKGMADFLSYNIYLTRWKETEVDLTSSAMLSVVHLPTHPHSTCLYFVRRLIFASTMRRRTTRSQGSNRRLFMGNPTGTTSSPTLHPSTQGYASLVHSHFVLSLWTFYISTTAAVLSSCSVHWWTFYFHIVVVSCGGFSLCQFHVFISSLLCLTVLFLGPQVQSGGVPVWSPWSGKVPGEAVSLLLCSWRQVHLQQRKLLR